MREVRKSIVKRYKVWVWIAHFNKNFYDYNLIFKLTNYNEGGR